MSHIERAAGCSADVGPGLVVASGWSGWSGSAGPEGGGGSVRAGGAIVGADVPPGAMPASAPVVPVRNGRSNASLSLETFLGPNPGSCASCAASAWAILAKLCVPFQRGHYRYRKRKMRTHAVRRAQGLDVGLVHARDARERRAEERAGRFVDAFADERWLAVLGLFVGGQVLSRFVCAV